MKAITRHGKVLKALDAVLTAPLTSRDSVLQHMLMLVNPYSTGYSRVNSIINLADRVIPGLSRTTSQYFLRNRLLPLVEGSMSLINFGTGSTVFRHVSPNGDYAVKISRQTLGLPLDKLLVFARRYVNNYNKLIRWYNSKHPMVPPSYFMMIHSGLLNAPCVACIQPYIQGEQQDLLRDFDDEQIIRMMTDNPQLREQFMRFITGTSHAIRSEGLCMDLLGKNNLMLLTQNNSARLLIVDYGIVNLDTLARDMPDKYKLFEMDIRRIKMLSARMAQIAS